MPEPVYDLMLGNIDGVRSAENPDQNCQVITDIDEIANHKANVVETRAQNIKQNKKNTLVVPEAVNEYSVKNLMGLQSCDVSLSYIRNQAQTGEIKTSRDESSIQYLRKKACITECSKKG